MAVVRFETAGRGLPPRDGVVGESIKAVEIPGVSALQIDFDARNSERAWYADVLRDLRHALPRKVPLTITALASWCDSGEWIETLPVADACPMLFRMGSGESRSPDRFPVRLCRSSVGVSTDEMPIRLPHGTRVFFFNPRSWTREAYQAVVAQTWRWR